MRRMGLVSSEFNLRGRMSTPPSLPVSPANLERFLQRYIDRVSTYSIRRFVMEMLLLSFILKIAFGVPLAFLVDDSSAMNADKMLADLPPFLATASALVFAPI